jgi:hypothetical protein
MTSKDNIRQNNTVKTRSLPCRTKGEISIFNFAYKKGALLNRKAPFC